MRPSCEAQTLGAKKKSFSQISSRSNGRRWSSKNEGLNSSLQCVIRGIFRKYEEHPNVSDFSFHFFFLLSSSTGGRQLSPFKPTGKYAIDTGRRTNGCRHIEYITSYPFQSDLWAHPREISALPSGDFHHHIWLKHTFKIHSAWIKHIFCRFSTMYTHLLQHFIRYTFQRSDPLLTPQLPYFFTA